jgi:hypothetical protein
MKFTKKMSFILIGLLAIINILTNISSHMGYVTYVNCIIICYVNSILALLVAGEYRIYWRDELIDQYEKDMQLMCETLERISNEKL